MSLDKLRTLHSSHDPERDAEQEEKCVKGKCTNAHLVSVHDVIDIILNVLVAVIFLKK